MNHYEFLGISRDACDDEIKNAYKRMAKKYHPDVTEGSADYAHEKMQQVNEAYGVLSNNALREEYDYSLWLQDRADKDANYASEFKDYVPRSPEDYQSSWQKFYKNDKKPGGIFGFNFFKPKSAKARNIMAVVWTVRILIPAIVLLVVFGLITNAAYMANILDRVYGRGTPAKVTGMFFSNIKEENFELSSRLTRNALDNHSSEMTIFVTAVSQAYNFAHGGVPFGEIWFSNTSRELSFKVQKTQRFGFRDAEVTVEVTNLNIQKIFLLAEHRIQEDLRKGTSKPILRQAVNEQNLSLLAEVYSQYMNSIMTEMPDEYLTATVVLTFSRTTNNWLIRSADDIGALRDVILGGFGDSDLSSYVTIDWLDVLRIT
jgi:curved DNA-binding protein CbpA